ncbi:MAG: hypothetical protein V4754_10235 [Pseudomonadota bacterium]
MTEKVEAIFFPLISRTTAIFTMVLCVILLGLAILVLPPDGKPLPSWAIPGALAMSSISRFPYAFGVSYSMAVYGGLCCGFISAFFRGNLTKLAEILLKQSVTFRLLCNLFMTLMIYLQLTQELPISPHQSSRTFFTAITHNRLVALIWVEGMFGVIFTATLVILFDIATLMRKILCK